MIHHFLSILKNMNQMKKIKHLHRYKRTIIGRSYRVYKCVKPDCTHYIPLHMAENKACECNRCFNPMILTKEAMRLAKPHCTDCIKRKKVQELDTISEFLERN